ncbi:MAG: four-carbon acid sugar kinase family protein [Limnochordia bacterium]|jgi:uncharacterized protein YgbK (DUF1537 family)
MRKLGLVADDLTGSNDTGVQFAKQGLATLVVLEQTSASQASGDHDVIVINLDSRADAPEEARQKAYQAARDLLNLGVSYIYKKIDSTLRGNLGPELEGVMDAAGVQAAFFVPALPANGRTTVGGYHLVKGQPVSQTEIARDLISPVTESHVPTLLARQCRRPVGHIPLGYVLGGQEKLVEAMEAELGRGKEIIVVDGVTEEHLTVIAEAIVQLGLAKVICGAAGLAEVLPRALGLRDQVAPRGGSPVLVMAGSRSQVTAEQIKAAARQGNGHLLLADDGAFAQDDTMEAELQRLYEQAFAQLEAGRDVLIALRETMENRRPPQGSRPADMSRRIAAGLGQVASQLVLSSLELSGLILTGGDTALAVCRQLEAAGLVVEDEVLPGIPYGRLLNGKSPGIRVVTKAGAFGDREAILTALQYLKRLG